MRKIVLLLCILFLLALCGCGAKTPPADADPTSKQPLPEETTSDSLPGTEPVERIAMGPALAEGPEGCSVLILTDFFSLTLPSEWASTCVYTVTDLQGRTYCVDIYEDEAYWDFGGGKLCSLMLLPTEDTSYKDFPDYTLLVALDTPEGSFNVIVLFPTDVQFNADTAETYNTMYDQLMDVLWSIHPVNGVEMSMP